MSFLTPTSPMAPCCSPDFWRCECRSAAPWRLPALLNTRRLLHALSAPRPSCHVRMTRFWRNERMKGGPMQRTFVCVMLMAVGAMWQSPCNLAPRDAGSRDPRVGRGGPKVHGAAQPSASLVGTLGVPETPDGPAIPGVRHPQQCVRGASRSRARAGDGGAPAASDRHKQASWWPL